MSERDKNIRALLDVAVLLVVVGVLAAIFLFANALVAR